MNPLAKLFVQVSADTTKFHSGMKQVNSSIQSTAKQASFFSSAITTATGTALGIMTTQIISSLKENIEWLKKTGYEFNSLKENSQLAFETMLGSGEKATQFLKDLTRFAERTPFELPGLIDASQKMIAFGFTSQQVLPTLTAIGDAVSGLGGSPEKLQRVITAIGQIKAKGKAQAQEMLQLAEAGIPAWDILAKHLGVTIPEAMKLSERGMVDADTAITTLIAGMNKKFGGLMEKQSKSFTGLKSTFNDLMREVAARLTKPWFDNAKKGLERFIHLLQSKEFQTFLDGMVKQSTKLANIVSHIKSTLFSVVLKGFNLIHSLFGKPNEATQSLGLVDTITKKASGIGKVLKQLGSFFYGLADKGFKLFASTFDSFYRSFSKIQNKQFYFFGDMSLEQFSKGIKSIFSDINSGGKNLNYWLYTAPKAFQVITRVILATKKIFSYLSGEGLQLTLKKLGSILTGLGTTLAKLVRPFKEALGSLFNQLSTMKNMGFADIFKAVLSSVGQAFTGFIKVVREEFWPTIKSAFEYVFDGLWSFVTTINWSGLWVTFVEGFKTIVDYVSSINWSNVWTTVWSGLTVVGSFIQENVVPIFSNFFSWLVSFFSDSTKNQQLLSAITSVWSFISDWANSITSVVTPYLSSFFDWLLSWFYDSNKRQQIWGAITTTWNWVTEWAKSIVSIISPHFSNLFSWLLGWVTDSSKRQQLLGGLNSTWNWLKEWSSYLWSSISPHLTNLWSYITSWVTDPSKRQQAWQSIVSGWNWFSIWASGIWTSVLPQLAIFATNLKTWIDTNYPNLSSWVDSFTSTTKQINGDWSSNWPKISQAFKDFSSTMKTEIPLIVAALKDLYLNLFGESETTLSDYFTQVVSFYTRYFSFLTKTARIATEMLNEMVETTKAAFNFDWNGYVSNSMEFGAKLSELVGHLSTMPQLGQGYATGGITQGGRVLVGERGPELVDLPGGSRVWDHGQSMGKLDNSNNRVDVHIHNESRFPIDRSTVQEIAKALQKELNLSGNRVVFST